MSIIQSDAVGVLLFNGPARITPVINMLFTPFNLNAGWSERDDQCYVDSISGDSDPSWDRYLDHLIEAIPESQRPTQSSDDEPADVLNAIGLHFGADVRDFADIIDFEALVKIADVVQLARRLTDGHNLRGLSIAGANHSTSGQLGSVGGWVTYVTPNCTLDLHSSEITAFASDLDEGLAQSEFAASFVLDRWINRTIEGIDDRVMRERLRFRYALKDPADPLNAIDHQWSRIVYVRTEVADGIRGPRWARFQLTRDFLRQLVALQTTCRMQDLAETSIHGRPDAWEPISADSFPAMWDQRLVVSNNSFWFTANVAHRHGAIRTCRQSIDSVLRCITDSTKPMYLGIDPDAVRKASVSEAYAGRARSLSAEPMSEAEYLAIGGTGCPFCRSTDIDVPVLHTVDIGSTALLIHCNGCNRRWTDHYRLTGYEADVA